MTKKSEETGFPMMASLAADARPEDEVVSDKDAAPYTDALAELPIPEGAILAESNSEGKEAIADATSASLEVPANFSSELAVEGTQDATKPDGVAIPEAPESIPEEVPVQPAKIDLRKDLTPIAPPGSPIQTGPVPKPLPKKEEPVVSNEIVEEKKELTGLEKQMVSMGIDPKHKPYVVIAMLVIAFAVLIKIVDSSKQKTNALMSGGEAVTKIEPAKGSMVVLIDPSRLIKAAVGQSMASSTNPGVKQVSSSELEKIIQDVVADYKSRGHVIMDRKMVFTASDGTDVTEMIAAKAGIDLRFEDENYVAEVAGFQSKKAVQ